MPFKDAADKSAYQKMYRQTHKIEIAASKKARYQSHKAKIASQAKAYRAAHKDEIAAYMKAWWQANPDNRADNNAHRRARKRGAFTENVKRAVVYERDGGRCHICGKKVPKKGWHLDHIIPLERGMAHGGEHSYKNVAVSCPSCNMHKHTKAGAQLRLL